MNTVYPKFAHSAEIESSLDAVNAEVNNLISKLDHLFGEYNRFALDLILRETLNNAVIHGNRYDVKHLVKLSIETCEDNFSISVEDSGVGFEWHSVINTESERAVDHGRGFPILKTYCSQIELNEMGNRISLMLSIMETKTSHRAESDEK